MQSPVRVAVLDGLGISSVCVSVTEKSFDEDDNVVYERLTPSDVNTEGVLDKFDVFVCPGGSFQGVHHALGPIGRERLRTFIQRHGTPNKMQTGHAFIVSNRTSILPTLALLAASRSLCSGPHRTELPTSEYQKTVSHLWG